MIKTNNFVRKIYSIIAVVLFSTTAILAQQTYQFSAAQKDSVNRAVATVVNNSIETAINSLINQGLPLDRESLGHYISLLLTGSDIGFTQQTATKYVDSVFHSMARLSDQSQNDFLQVAASSPGAVVTPSGLVFLVIQEGEGIKPTVNDRVHVKYVGKFSNGQIFDDTGDEIVTFDLASEIPGFAEGLQMMKPSGTYKITLPPALAYGEDGIPGIIPPNAALEFTVTLDSISPAE